MSNKNDSIGKILFTKEDIEKRAKELGKQITSDYKGEEVIVIGTLKGSIMWMAELLKNIDLDTQIDFTVASSYGSNTTSSGMVKIKLEPDTNMYNKNILIVEDIVDTGKTLTFLIQKMKERHPKSIKVCTMLDKPSRRINDYRADYIGYKVDDLFVIGFGLDFDQKYRNLPYISYLDGENI